MERRQRPKAIVNLEFLPSENVFQNNHEHFLHQNFTLQKKLKTFKKMKSGISKRNEEPWSSYFISKYKDILYHDLSNSKIYMINYLKQT